MKKMHILFLFWLISVSSAWGQANMSLINFRLDESDLSANSYDTEKFDLNGKKCALIKIETTRTGFGFDNGSSAKPTDIQYKKGQIWVYVSPGVRRLNIYHENLGIIEYVFPIPIEAAKTYKVTLTAKDVVEIETAASVQVALRASDGVEIFMEGKRLGLRQWTGVLKSGDYSVECRKENCYPSITKIAVYAAEGAKLMFDLKTPVPIMSSLSVTTTPGGSRLWIDGEDKGLTPREDSVSVGSHRIKLQCDGYETKEFLVSVERGKTKRVNEILSQWTDIEIDALLKRSKEHENRAQGISLWIDGKEICSTCKIPTAQSHITYGTHAIQGKVFYAGHFFGCEKDIVVSYPNQKIQLTLTRIPYEFVKPNVAYMELFGQMDISMPITGGMGGTVGGYVKGANIEVSGFASFSNPKMYWYDLEGTHIADAHYRTIQIKTKTGYGFRLTRTVGLTPQAGFGWSFLKGNHLHKQNGQDNTLKISPYSISFEVSVRLVVGLCRNISFVMVPEYGLSFASSESYSAIMKSLSIFDAWKNRLGIRFGLAVNLDKQ